MAPARFTPDVMLLAAGLGTRMRPLTDTRPKPLVPVAGVPLIDRVVAAARAAGLTRFVVNAHHHADQIAAHAAALEAGHPGTRFRVSREAELLGIGGGIRAALPLLETDPILVMNTDAFWLGGCGDPILRLLDRYARGGAEVVQLCVHPRDARGFRRSHDFCLDPLGRITTDAGAPVIYAGVMLIARGLLDGAPEGPSHLAPLIDLARERGTLFGTVLDAPWLHVGDPQGLAEAEALLEARV